MKRSRSIQFRLTAWYALLLAAALGLFSGMIWLSLRDRLIDETDRELKATSSRFEAYFRRQIGSERRSRVPGELEEFCQALPPSSFIRLTSTAGFQFEYPVHATAELRNLRTFEQTFRLGTETFSLEAGTSMRGIHHTLELLRLLLLSLIPAVIAIACLGGAWLSRRALKPVDEITAAARAIGIENLSLRLPVPPTGDELERLTEVWNTMLSRLQSAVTTLSQFAADASHELRTPLAVIRTSAELALRRARSPESYRESLAEIAGEAAHMTQLVEDLLFLARGDSKVAAMPMTALDLRDILRDVTSELRGLAEVRGIHLRSVSPDTEILVSGNAVALRRLFLVLLDNAVKYSHPAAEVTIAISRNADRATVAVQDTGIGIAPADLPLIFDRFYRADKARSNGGHGLGLSLAATIARAHGATIDVSSSENSGSTFSVQFPLRSGIALPGPQLTTALPESVTSDRA